MHTKLANLPKYLRIDLYQSMEKVVQEILNHQDAEPFMEIPSFQDYPDYPDVISRPICLEDVQEKVENKRVTILNQFKADLLRIWENCQMYNEEKSEIFQYSVVLRDLTEKVMTREGIWDKPNLTKRMKNLKGQGSQKKRKNSKDGRQEEQEGLLKRENKGEQRKKNKVGSGEEVKKKSLEGGQVVNKRVGKIRKSSAQSKCRGEPPLVKVTPPVGSHEIILHKAQTPLRSRTQNIYREKQAERRGEKRKENREDNDESSTAKYFQQKKAEELNLVASQPIKTEDIGPKQNELVIKKEPVEAQNDGIIQDIPEKSSSIPVKIMRQIIQKSQAMILKMVEWVDQNREEWNERGELSNQQLERLGGVQREIIPE